LKLSISEILARLEQLEARTVELELTVALLRRKLTTQGIAA